MSSLLAWFTILIVSLFVLIKASDFFTDSAIKIGLYFGIPDFIVGVIIVSIGTSLPELISSILAVLNNCSEIVVGNVLGSNITNIFLVLGVSAIVGRKIQITYDIIHVDLPILVGSAFLLAATLYNGIFNIFEALLCLAGFVLYFCYAILGKRKVKDGELETEHNREKEFDRKILVYLIVAVLFIYFSAKYTIEAVVRISEILNIGKEVIAASAIALGTSFPELIVSVMAAKKGNPEIAVGNVLGSNIFNSFAVMGISAIVGSLVVPQGILTFSLPLMLIGTMLMATILYIFITHDKEVTKWEGWLLVIFYLFFIGKLYNLF